MFWYKVSSPVAIRPTRVWCAVGSLILLGASPFVGIREGLSSLALSPTRLVYRGISDPTRRSALNVIKIGLCARGRGGGEGD